MDDVSKKGIVSRKEFLKTSSVITGGLTFLPSALRAALLSDEKKIGSEAESYQIVYSRSNNNLIEEKAARQLKNYLAKAEIDLPIIDEESYQGDQAIYIGRTRYAEQMQIDYNQLGKDGYVFKKSGDNFVVAGGSEKGVLYGVYGFLESIGYRKYDSVSTFVPEIGSIQLPLDSITLPGMVYRQTSYYDTDDGDIFDWHRLDSSSESWGMFVHTFFELVPPEQFGESHPEYYSWRDGKRNPSTQLCLSNEEVLDIVVENLRKRMAEKPEALYWSVSPEDNDQYCTCEPCTKLNEKYGGTRPELEYGVPSGSLIYFVNKVAREFPDKIISTLAYWYTRQAPDHIKPGSNVNIMLCPIGPARHRPIFETAPSFTKDLEDWGEISNRILIWDYNIQFANPVSPFPNLHTLKPNIKFYKDNSVDSLFMQATSQAGSEMASLRSYLISKLMWNPEADENQIINDFLDGYYGEAGTYIRKYIDTMKEALLASNHELKIFDSPIDAKETYLSAGLMEDYEEMFDNAEQAVEDDSERLQRVKTARLPLMFAQIQIGRTEVDTPRSMFAHNEEDRIVVKPEMKELVYQFVDRCKEYGVNRIRERTTSADEYLLAYQRIFDKMDEVANSKSLHKKVTPITKSSEHTKGVEALTDGVFGSDESWRFPDKIGVNWVGFEGEHMEFLLDLGEVQLIQTINMDFLNAQAQPKWHLTILPKFVEYRLSVDGENFDEPVRIINPHDPNPDINPKVTSVRVQSFQAELQSKRARYIKVHAESPIEMPSWHIRAGQPAKIYADEIVVM
ncbi:MAG: DUF4838 domain-containing protein [Bacteroidetes bacterium]|jgi:hypothetical protein|nr:DUF4838 domain-containing protein [Bacteroidota bacterium]